MEYALWLKGNEVVKSSVAVLILVLMEYALWQGAFSALPIDGTPVLILVLMEYALWRGKYLSKLIKAES